MWTESLVGSAYSSTYNHQWRRPVLKIGGPNSFFRPSFSLSFTFPPLKSKALKCSQSQGERCKLPKWGLGQSEIEFCTFYPQNLTYSGNDSNDFPDNQLAKFRKV